MPSCPCHWSSTPQHLRSTFSGAAPVYIAILLVLELKRCERPLCRLINMSVYIIIHPNVAYSKKKKKKNALAYKQRETPSTNLGTQYSLNTTIYIYIYIYIKKSRPTNVLWRIIIRFIFVLVVFFIWCIRRNVMKQKINIWKSNMKLFFLYYSFWFYFLYDVAYALFIFSFN